MNWQKMDKPMVIIFSIFLFFLFPATGWAPVLVTPEEYFFEQGKEAFEHQDLLGAHYSFEEALYYNPDHPGANLFYALTRILMISKSTNFNKLLDRTGMSTSGRDLFDWTADFKRDLSGNIVLSSGSPTGKDWQDFLKNDVLSQVNGALDNLFYVPMGYGTTFKWIVENGLGYFAGSPNNTLIDISKRWVPGEWAGYKLLINGAVYNITNNSVYEIYTDVPLPLSSGTHIYDVFGNVEIDYGDVSVLKGSLYMAKAMILALSSYDLNIDIDAIVTLYHSARLDIQNNIINLYKNLLNLLPTQQLSEAKSALREALSNFFQAISFIAAEQDLQDDDLILIDPLDVQPYLDLLADLNNSLDGTTLIRKIGLDINLSEFFDYPKNLRGYLPIFVGSSYMKRGSFPDPTFGGILPSYLDQDGVTHRDMTREELQRRLEKHIRESYPITPLVLYDDFLGPKIDKNRWVEGEWNREIIKTGDYLYDNFSGTRVDNKKWRQGDFLREIQTGKAVFKQASPNPITVGSFTYGESNWLSFPEEERNSVNSIQADVVVLESGVTNSARARARLAGTWYLAGPSGEGQTGDIWANVEIRQTSTRLFARWSIDRCTNKDCSTSDYPKNGEFLTTINLGQTYTLYIEYDSDHHRFVFRVNNEQIVFDDPTLPAKLGEAVNPQKGIGTRVDIDDATSSGYISATFDNVIAKDGSGLVVVSDNFSSPTINPNNWSTYEFAREIKGGKFRSKIRSSEESTSLIQSAIDFEMPTTINNFQAKMTPITYQNSAGVDQWAGIWAGAYNDGTGNATPGDRKGDVCGAVRLGGTAAKPTAKWQVFKMTNAGGTSYQPVASGDFITSVSLGATYTLFVGWDGAQFTFKFNNEVANYKPTTVNPIKVPFKGLGTQIPQPINNEGVIEAQFDDVTIDVANIAGGSDYKLLFKHASPNPSVVTIFPYTTYNQLAFVDPNTVNSMQADVSIVDNVIEGSAWTTVRLDGRFYNDGTTGGGYAGDIYAEVALGWTSKGLRGWWWVGRYTGSETSSLTRLTNGSGNFSTAITPGVTYPLYIGYDGTNRFTFRIGSEEYTFTGPTKVKPAQKPWKSPTTRVQIDDAGSSAYVSTTFDNFYKNGVLYDLFIPPAIGNPTINESNWTTYENVREISGGKLRSKVRSSLATTATVSSRLNLLYPSEIRAIQTKVTPITYQNDEGASLRARIVGIFYNDGTPGGGSIGDVGAQVRIGGNQLIPTVDWVVFTFTDVDGKCSEIVASGAFNTPISVDGKTSYTLFLGWDGWQFTFKVGNEVAYYVPETGVYPANKSWKGLDTQVYYNCTDPTGKRATIEALFDDVMVSGPLLSVSPASYNFGNLIARTKSLNQTFSFSNNGATSIGIESIDLVGIDAAMFNIESTTCPGHSSTHPPKGKCNIVTSFQPTSEGEKSAALRFTLNTVAPASSSKTAMFMPLKGTGLLETISTPTTLVGTTSGTTGTTYAFTTGGSSSNLTPLAQHPIQYLFDWDDGTNSGWLPVGTTSAKKMWTSSGTYSVKAMARCATHKAVASSLSLPISVSITIPIHPTSPRIGSQYNVSTLYPCGSPIPGFAWTVDGGQAFTSYKIQFSTDFKFRPTIDKPIEVPSLTTTATIPKPTWQTILSKPGKSGGVLYWRVVGTRSDATIATGEPSFILVDGPQPVLDVRFSHTSKTATPPPTLTWNNNYNAKFKVYVANDADFSKPGIKKFISQDIFDDPCADGGIFNAPLTPSQWASVWGVVNGVVGSRIYWYVESWDILAGGRNAKTGVESFILQP